MRLFIASIATETNTFAPFPAGRAAYEAYGITRDASQSTAGYASGPVSVFRSRAAALGIEVVESLCVFAQPLAATVRSVYEEFRDAMLADLAAVGEVDIVLLMLHGAMVAEGHDDCEGDMLHRVRALCPEAVIGAELDPHCHLTETMVAAADLLVIFKEYPHFDVVERAEELFDLSYRTWRGEIAPTAALVDTRLIAMYPTLEPPMQAIVAALREAEQRADIVSASIAHGFPWGDVADVGTRVLVYADGAAEPAIAVANDIAERLYAARHAQRSNLPGISESLDRAATLTGRVVLGDYADNPGGGAPSDSTFFLREIIERGLVDVALGSIHDPAVAQICADAGVGARLTVRVGGKAGPMSGDPLDLSVEVMAVVPDHVQTAFDTRVGMGLTVWLRHGGVDFLVNSIRGQVYGTDLFTGCGLELADKRLIVVKSSVHFEQAFGPIADHLWRVTSPGALDLDFANFAYTKRDGTYFPRVDDPWAVAGRPAPLVFAPRRRALTAAAAAG